MSLRSICPDQGVPTDLDDCIYRCFEAHRRQVLQRRARRKRNQQQKCQQSFQTEQYQTFPSQPSIPTSYYTNIIQDTPRYQTLIEPPNITVPIQTSEQRTFEYSNIDQPIDNRYESLIQDTPSSYQQLKEVQYTSQQPIPCYTNINEQAYETAAYTNENTTQYQTPASQVYDSHITNQQTAGYSLPTGTVEYTRKAYSSQDIYNQPYETTAYNNENTTQYQAPASHVYESHITNQQTTGSSIPTGTVEYTRKAYYSQEPIQTYDQNIYTNEQIVPQQHPSLPLYEENQQNLVQQTIANEPLEYLPVTSDIHQQREYVTAKAPCYPCISTLPSQPLPSSIPSDNGNDDDLREDEEIFDLRACICRCYARFKDVWNKDQQERYQEQFRDIQPVEQPIPPSIHTFTYPPPAPVPIPCYNYYKHEQPIVYNQVVPAPPPQPCYVPEVPILPSITTFTQPPPAPIPLPSYNYYKPEQQIVYNQVVSAPPPQPQYVPHILIPPQIVPPPIQTFEQTPIPQPQIPSIPTPAPIIPREIDQTIPRIDARTGLCLVPCPETIKYAHLPPHLRPELFCTELPPASSLPPPPPPLPPPPPSPQPVVQAQRWCVRCCCEPGQSLIKKIVYREIEEEKQHQEESYMDYASVIDQLQTKITVRYGNSIMEEGEAFVCGNYNEELRIIDFPVYVSGEDDFNLTPLIPNQ